MTASQHFLRIEGDYRPTIVCTAPDDAPCHMACATCEESCSCDEPVLANVGECNWALWLNESDVMECGSGVALLPVDIKWSGGDDYEWTFTQQVTS